MFGYVKPHISELKIKEYEDYRSYYCGLCHSMTKYTGKTSGCALSNDFVFLFMLRSLLEQKDEKKRKRRCLVHPLKPHDAVDYNSISEYCAYTSIMLASFKLNDDIADEKGKRKIKACLGKMLIGRKGKRCEKKYRELADFVNRELKKLSCLEKNNTNQLDECANISGNILASIFSYGYSGGIKSISSRLGMCIGKLIYILDAVDDYAEDVKNGRFNVVFNMMSCTEDNISSEQMTEHLRIILLNLLSDACAAFDLVECDYSDTSRNIGAVINNIFCVGFPLMINKAIKAFADCVLPADKTI